MGFSKFSQYARQDSTYTTIPGGNREILAGGGATGGDIASNSPELQAIVDAWPELPRAIKADIAAMVRATKRN